MISSTERKGNTMTATYNTAIESIAAIYEEFDADNGYGERHGAVLVVAAMFGVKPSKVKVDVEAFVR